jgi:RNA:NAD 2'-phosphotransferase (TPT1/KptA family)
MFKFIEISSGWLKYNLILQHDTINIWASDLENTLGEFIDAVTNLKEKGNSEFGNEQEPGNYIVGFALENNTVTVTLKSCDENIKLIAEDKIQYEKLILDVYNFYTDILESMSFVEIKNVWGFDFPLYQYKNLKELINIGEFETPTIDSVRQKIKTYFENYNYSILIEVKPRWRYLDREDSDYVMFCEKIKNSPVLKNKNLKPIAVNDFGYRIICFENEDGVVLVEEESDDYDEGNEFYYEKYFDVDFVWQTVILQDLKNQEQTILDARQLRIDIKDLSIKMLIKAPLRYGLIMDDEGWIHLEAVYKAQKCKGFNLGPVLTKEILGENLEFEIVENKIRYAKYRTIKIQNNLVPIQILPETLYYSVSYGQRKKVIKNGATKVSNNFYYLANNLKKSTKIAKEDYKKVSIFKLDIAKIKAVNIKIYNPSEDIWLVEEIPPNFIEYCGSIENPDYSLDYVGKYYYSEGVNLRPGKYKIIQGEEQRAIIPSLEEALLNKWAYFVATIEFAQGKKKKRSTLGSIHFSYIKVGESELQGILEFLKSNFVKRKKIIGEVIVDYKFYDGRYLEPEYSKHGNILIHSYYRFIAKKAFITFDNSIQKAFAGEIKSNEIEDDSFNYFSKHFGKQEFEVKFPDYHIATGTKAFCFGEGINSAYWVSSKIIKDNNLNYQKFESILKTILDIKEFKDKTTYSLNHELKNNKVTNWAMSNIFFGKLKTPFGIYSKYSTSNNLINLEKVLTNQISCQEFKKLWEIKPGSQIIDQKIENIDHNKTHGIKAFAITNNLEDVYWVKSELLKINQYQLTEVNKIVLQGSKKINVGVYHLYQDYNKETKYKWWFTKVFYRNQKTDFGIYKQFSTPNNLVNLKKALAGEITVEEFGQLWEIKPENIINPNTGKYFVILVCIVALFSIGISISKKFIPQNKEIAQQQIYKNKKEWTKYDIAKYLLEDPDKKVGMDDLAYIKSKTSKVIFAQYITETDAYIAVNDPVKITEFQNRARSIGDFFERFPTAYESYIANSENIKLHFYKEPVIKEKLGFGNFMNVVNDIKTKGKSSENKIELKKKNKIYILNLNTTNREIIDSLQIIDNQTITN